VGYLNVSEAGLTERDATTSTPDAVGPLASIEGRLVESPSAGRVTDETDYFRLADDSLDWSRIKPKRTTTVNYSYFRATMGSTRVARRAGM
jgi:hypothetical protein